MSRVAVIYKSKYGTTKQYATWISEEVSGDLFEADKVKVKDLEGYDTIVFGGCIHAGGIQGLKFIQKNFDQIIKNGARILVFAVGLNVDDEKNQEECISINFKKKLEGTKCFFMRGGYDPKVVGGLDKKMMGMIQKIVSSKAEEEKTQSDKDLLYALNEGADFSKKEYIKPLIDAIKEE